MASPITPITHVSHVRHHSPQATYHVDELDEGEAELNGDGAVHVGYRPDQLVVAEKQI